MPAFIRTAAVAGLMFGLAIAVVLRATSGDVGIGVVGGLIGGVAFGVVIAGFASYQTKKFAAHDPTDRGERVLKHGPANHFRRGEAVGGYLYLTDTRLLFQSHSFNIQNHEQSISLESITDVRPRMTLLVIPNGLQVGTPVGAERFVVHERNSWVQAILSARAAIDKD